MPGDTKRDLQTVGEFAETAGLPARTLRDDDQIGLFRPSHGDPVSHCRYDFPRQMPELRRMPAPRQARQENG